MNLPGKGGRKISVAAYKSFHRRWSASTSGNPCSVSGEIFEEIHDLKVPDVTGSNILSAKSGISNHTASGIFDDPCLSKL